MKIARFAAEVLTTYIEDGEVVVIKPDDSRIFHGDTWSLRFKGSEFPGIKNLKDGDHLHIQIEKVEK